MTVLKEVVKGLPAEIQPVVRAIWEGIPEKERGSFATLLRGMPGNSKTIRPLLAQASTQWQLAFGDKQRVAIVGPANVGKSTLYNHLVQDKKDQAAVSPIPGTTRCNQQADAGLFELVDTPGADMGGETGAVERRQAFTAAHNADLLVILFDAVQGVKQTEQELFEQLKALQKPWVLGLNKIDLVRKDARKVVEHTAQALGIKPEQVIPIAAKDGKNLTQLLAAMAVTEPRLVAAMGRAMPHYRWQLAWRAINNAASIASGIALTPLPMVDFAPLVITQSVMVLSIARIYNYRITLGRARELVATFGMGFLGRMIFQQFSKLGGVPGWLLAAAVAASTTIAMGYAATVWFERGERLSNETLKQMTRTITGYLLERLRGLGKRKPGQASLRQRISEALDASALAQDPSLLDQQLST